MRIRKRILNFAVPIKYIKTENPVALLEIPYDDNEFLEAIKGLETEPEGGKRCTECFILRMELAAKTAKENNFDYFKLVIRF